MTIRRRPGTLDVSPILWLLAAACGGWLVVLSAWAVLHGIALSIVGAGA